MGEANMRAFAEIRDGNPLYRSFCQVSVRHCRSFAVGGNIGTFFALTIGISTAWPMESFRKLWIRAVATMGITRIVQPSRALVPRQVRNNVSVHAAIEEPCATGLLFICRWRKGF